MGNGAALCVSTRVHPRLYPRGTSAPLWNFLHFLQWTGPVSGHDFSRADDNRWHQGFSPCLRGFSPAAMTCYSVRE
jgi:hypothetical protein